MLPLIIAAGLALAQVDGCSKDTDCTHRHRGFFLRPDIGFGYLTASMSESGGDYTVSGPGAYLGLAIGGSVADGVIVAGRLWGMGAPSPTVTFNSQGGAPGESGLRFAAIGPEFDYYFMPANFFLGATLALSRIALKMGGRITAGGNDYSTDFGVAAQLAAGKEWWVSNDWALGLKGELTITVNQDKGVSNQGTWLGFGFAIGFSATYN